LRILLIALAAITSFTATTQLRASEKCNPVDFLVSENTDLLKNDIVQLAFVQVANKEQWDRAKQGGKLDGTGYGGLSFQQAKDKGKKESEAVQFALKEDQSYHLIANRISTVGGNAYARCLENEAAGISVWLDKDAGEYIAVKVKFRPRDADFRVRPPVLRNFRLTSRLPNKFIPQDPQTLNFRRLSDRAGTIEVYIGKESGSLLFPPVPKAVTYETVPFKSREVASATQAFRVRRAPAGIDEKCTNPPTGWTFVRGSALAIMTVTTVPSNYATIIKDEEQIICWRATALTGDRRIYAHVEAIAVAQVQRRSAAKQ
jgi:hypothetical protein